MGQSADDAASLPPGGLRANGLDAANGRTETISDPLEGRPVSAESHTSMEAMVMRTRVNLTVLLAFIVLLPLAGCGSGGDGASTTTTPEKNGGSTNTPKLSGSTNTPSPELHPEVVLHTNLGDIKLRLDVENSPLTVANFLEYVDSGQYDGTIFHQVVDNYIVLAGGYTADFTEKPTRQSIRNEAGDNGLKNKRGTIAMARQADAIDSSTCQFFINLADNDNLDHKGREVEDYGYCVFGEVIGGLDIVEKMAKAEVTDKEKDGEVFQLTPQRTVLIESAKRTR